MSLLLLLSFARWHENVWLLLISPQLSEDTEELPGRPKGTISHCVKMKYNVLAGMFLMQ